MARTGLVVRLGIKPGRMQEFLDIVRAHGARSLELEPGCERFDVLRPLEGEDTVFLYEVYSDEAALQAHWGSVRMAAYRERTGDMIASRDPQRCELLD